MAFRTTHSWQIKPGRLASEVVPLLQASRAIHTRHGAEVSAWTILLGGPNTGRILYAMEYADSTSFGASFASFGADPEWQQLWMKINGPESPIALASAFAGSSFRGIEDPKVTVPGPRVRANRFLKIETGGMAAAVALLSEARSHLMRLGVPRVRVIAPIYSGEAAFQAVIQTEYPGLVAFGQIQDGIAANATFQAFLAEKFNTAGAPLTMVASGMQVEMALV